MANLRLGLGGLTQNRYAFLGANPVNYVEVDGHTGEPTINAWYFNGGNSWTYNVSNANLCQVQVESGGIQPFAPDLNTNSSVTAGNGGKAGQLSCWNHDIGPAQSGWAGPSETLALEAAQTAEPSSALAAQPVLDQSGPARTLLHMLLDAWSFDENRGLYQTLGVCGPGQGLLEKLIPDGFPGLVDFRDACGYHDRCYGRWNQVRSTCDAIFHTRMLETCETIPW